MKNNTRILINMLLMIIAVIVIILGVASGVYVISIAGILIFFGMLILRGVHIRKLNREIKEIKEPDHDEIDDNQV
ncbi:MAG: hypothetical protein K9N05_04180 [Candidatus Marinimicrobia bacterium]|nr:hypothetical protein [Candidatus Neomarinimicrobiota bacterium]